MDSNNSKDSALRKIGHGLKVYLTDWRNLLVHGLVGIGLVLIAIYLPVKVWLKIIIFLCVIAFNCIRMSRKKKKEAAKAAAPEGSAE